MESRNVIITGANSGIGEAATLRFAQEGHSIIMACRDTSRSADVRDEIISSTGNEKIDLLEVDTASFASIVEFCDMVEKHYSHIDVLIHNAAYFSHGAPYRLSEDQIEITFATNVFGPFLMTLRLLPLMKQSADARILHAGSNIIKHFFDPAKEINFSILKNPQPPPVSGYKVYNSYRDSKMALLMLTFKMAEQLTAYGINVNSLQINGARMSKETLKKVTPGYRMIARLQNLFFRPPAFTADLYYRLCTSPDFASVTGKHFNHKLEVMQPGRTDLSFLQSLKQLSGASFYPPYADDTETADRLWELCKTETQKYLRSEKVL